MSFKLGVAEASKRNEEKIKGSTQGFSGGFRWKFFFCVGFFFLVVVGWLVFVVWVWWGFVVFYNLWGILFWFCFSTLLFLTKIQTAKKSLNSVESRD